MNIVYSYSILLIIILLIFCYKIYSCQYLPIFHLNELPYICNTFIEINKQISIEEIETQLKIRIKNIELLKNKNCIYVVNSTNDFFTLDNSQYRFLLFYNNSKTYICFQNHRSLCGGQERIWKIVNYILDSPRINENINYIKNTPLISDIIKYNPIMNIYNYIPFTKKMKYFGNIYVKTIDIKKIGLLCNSFNCSKNDLVIGITCEYIIQNKIIYDEYIRIFVPINVQNQYGHIIIEIPNVQMTFQKMMDSIIKITEKSLKNYYIKKSSIITNKLLTINSFLFSECYKNCINSCHVFISYITSFKNNRTFFKNKIHNIYQFYHSYNSTIQVGVSSYHNNFTITFNY